MKIVLITKRDVGNKMTAKKSINFFQNQAKLTNKLLVWSVWISSPITTISVVTIAIIVAATSSWFLNIILDNWYELKSNKEGCIFPIFDVSRMPLAEFGLNDYRVDAPHFTLIAISMKSPIWNFDPLSVTESSCDFLPETVCPISLILYRCILLS